MKKLATDFGIYVVEDGPSEAPAVVFLHAFPLSHEMWLPQIALLAPTHRCVAYDARGLGSSELGDGQYTMEGFVEDLRSVMDLLGVGKAALCGLSMGGYAALRAAEKFPDRVSALVLCNTRSEADDNAGKLKRAGAIQMLQTQGADAFARSFLSAALSPTTQSRQPELTARWTPFIGTQSVQGMVGAHLAMMSRTDTTEFLPKIKVPTLVIHGEEDAVIPIATARAMQGRIPGAQWAPIPGAGHLSNLEQPEAFNRALAAFIQGLRAT